MRAEDLLPITNMGPLDPLSIIALALIVIIAQVQIIGITTV
jgi:hypothetical protein